jgi:hypothetical protein
MSETARESRRKFSAYFGNKSNVISRVRQKVAFHFDRKEIDDLYAALEDDYSFVTYVGSYLGYNLFFGSEMISLSAMAALADAPTPLEGIEKFYSDTMEVSAWLGYFVVGFMRVIVQQYIRPIRPDQIENMSVDEQGFLNLYTLPFFAAPEIAKPTT